MGPLSEGTRKRGHTSEGEWWIGTRTFTNLGQIAGKMLSLNPDKVLSAL